MNYPRSFLPLASRPRGVSATMPHTVLNACGILPVRRPHAALLAKAQVHVKRSRATRRAVAARPAALALDY